MKFWLGSLLMATVALGQVATLRQPPLITGYLNQGCVVPGGELTIQGSGFGDRRGDNRVMLWEAGQSVEMFPVLWRDNQLTVRVPADRRVVPGRQYQVRIEDFSGRLISNIGPALTICAEQAAEDPGTVRARQLATAVVQASGGNQWRQVKSIRFTFNVAQGEKTLMTAEHDWNLAAATDTVKWNDKQVTVNLRKPGTDANSKAAYARWVNDSYWLLAPLKLLDAGVRLSYVGTRVVEGRQYEVIRTTYEAVGLTPGDKYNFYIDPTTHRVTYWDYQADTPKAVSGTWEKYEKFGPLTLSTEHKFGDKRIWFTGVEVK